MAPGKRAQNAGFWQQSTRGLRGTMTQATCLFCNLPSRNVGTAHDRLAVTKCEAFLDRDSRVPQRKAIVNDLLLGCCPEPQVAVSGEPCFFARQLAGVLFDKCKTPDADFPVSTQWPRLALTRVVVTTGLPNGSGASFGISSLLQHRCRQRVPISCSPSLWNHIRVIGFF